jgi:hypothetical protein
MTFPATLGVTFDTMIDAPSIPPATGSTVARVASKLMAVGAAGDGSAERRRWRPLAQLPLFARQIPLTAGGSWGAVERRVVFFQLRKPFA